jgi:hypothetical protein
VLASGSMEKLAEVMGHTSTEVTGRYARLRPDLFREADHELLDVDLARGRRGRTDAETRCTRATDR